MIDNKSITTKKELTAEQEVNSALIRVFIPGRQELFAMSGGAGTGKTTMIGAMRDEYKGMIIAAPSNRAAAVLRSKGLHGATTLDKALKSSVHVSRTRPLTAKELDTYALLNLIPPETVDEDHYEKTDRPFNGLPLVIDEASMTSGEDVLSAIGVAGKVIAVGDGFQLPPVTGTPWFQHVAYDCTLEKVLRTGEGSEITEATAMIRKRIANWWKLPWVREVSVVSKRDLNPDILASANIVIASKNATCDVYNALIRKAEGLTSAYDPYEPARGDRLVALEAIKSEGINKSDFIDVLMAASSPGGYTIHYQNPDSGRMGIITINAATLREQKSTVAIGGTYRFAYAHCITAHRSQGSEWGNVVVDLTDAGWIKRQNGKSADICLTEWWSWVYTACTRAQHSLTVIV